MWTLTLTRFQRPGVAGMLLLLLLLLLILVVTYNYCYHWYYWWHWYIDNIDIDTMMLPLFVIRRNDCPRISTSEIFRRQHRHCHRGPQKQRPCPSVTGRRQPTLQTDGPVLEEVSPEGPGQHFLLTQVLSYLGHTGWSWCNFSTSTLSSRTFGIRLKPY